MHVLAFVYGSPYIIFHDGEHLSYIGIPKRHYDIMELGSYVWSSPTMKPEFKYAAIPAELHTYMEWPADADLVNFEERHEHDRYIMVRMNAVLERMFELFRETHGSILSFSPEHIEEVIRGIFYVPHGDVSVFSLDMERRIAFSVFPFIIFALYIGLHRELKQVCYSNVKCDEVWIILFPQNVYDLFVSWAWVFLLMASALICYASYAIVSGYDTPILRLAFYINYLPEMTGGSTRPNITLATSVFWIGRCERMFSISCLSHICEDYMGYVSTLPHRHIIIGKKDRSHARR